MDPQRLIVRTAFAYVFILALLRVSGKRTVKQGDIASFVVALIIGDMFDDAIWAEVPASQFVAGVGTLVFLHVVVSVNRFTSGSRTWLRGGERR
jgi:uncharacterized membrane protein YcaP (DUF421 family)